MNKLRTSKKIIENMGLDSFTAKKFCLQYNIDFEVLKNVILDVYKHEIHEESIIPKNQVLQIKDSIFKLNKKKYLRLNNNKYLFRKITKKFVMPNYKVEKTNLTHDLIFRKPSSIDKKRTIFINVPMGGKNSKYY